MKKLYYYDEKTKYYHLVSLLTLVPLFLGTYFLDGHENYAYLGVSIMLMIVNVYEGSKGFSLLHKKRVCKTKGEEFEGRIVGKIGRSTNRKGYFYQLVVLYSNGKVKTPLIQSKYVDRLANRSCSVHEYNGMTYVDDYELCDKKAAPIEIRIISEQ